MRRLLAATLVAAAALTATPPANADARNCVRDFLAGAVTAEPGPGGSGVYVNMSFFVDAVDDPTGTTALVLSRTLRLAACARG